jgi:hypothetical protein
LGRPNSRHGGRGPRASGQKRSIPVPSGQPQSQMDGPIGLDRAAVPYMACKRSGVRSPQLHPKSKTSPPLITHDCRPSRNSCAAIRELVIVTRLPAGPGGGCRGAARLASTEVAVAVESAGPLPRGVSDVAPCAAFWRGMPGSPAMRWRFAGRSRQAPNRTGPSPRGCRRSRRPG